MLKYFLRSLTLVFILLAKPIKAQENSLVKFKNFGIPEGLSMSTVFDIEQTPDGYVWLATADGLNRFDGYEFKVFKNIPNNKKSLQENYITALEVDNNGDLWVGTNAGYLSVYKLKEQSFTRKEFYLQSGESNRSKITAIKWDSRGVLWIGTEENGLFSLQESKLVRYHTGNSDLLSNNIQKIHLSLANSTMYIGTAAGLNVWDGSGDKRANKQYLKGGIITGIAVENKVMYVATQGNGRFLIQNDTIVSLANREGADNISDFLIDAKGNTWIGTFSQGIIKKTPNGQYLNYYNDPLDRNSLVNNVVFKVFQDLSGNIWVGTLSGLSIYSPLVHQFGLISSDKGNVIGLKDDNIYNIYEDSKRDLWFCTYDGGLSKWSRKQNKITNYLASNTKGLENNSTRVILEESLGKYWVGTGSFGLYLFDENNKVFDAIEMESNLDYVRSLVKTDPHTLWIGCQNGLFKYDIQAKKAIKMKGPLLQGLYQIEHLPQANQLLIGCFGTGVLLFDLATNKVVKQYIHKESDSLSIGNNNIMCIVPWEKQKYLIGTYGGGFSVFELEKGTFKNYGVQDGLSNEAIYGIIRDGDEVWLSSNKGLTKFNLKNQAVKNYENLSQVQSLEFNEGAFLKDSEGQFYFGGINGVNYFKPDQLIENNIPPKVIIQKVKIFEEEFPFRSNLAQNGVINLKYKQNFVGFEFVAINYSNPEKCVYEYKLEGVDNDWVSTRNSRYAKYINLSPGHYTFLVRASNEDGVWTEEAKQIQIEIASPFWLRLWFIVLVALILLGLAVFVVFQRTKRLKNRYQVKVLDMELKALRSQMNPHFIFNSINSIQYYILNKNPKTAYTYLSKFSTLMRLILNNSRVDFITLKEEVEALSIYLDLEKMRLEEELEYSISVDDQLEVDAILIPSMIVQPYVENAILHGLAPKTSNRKLHVHMSKIENQIYCVIEDNGIGRNKAKELNSNRTRKHQSTGMQVTKGRLELLNKENFKNLSVKIIDLMNENDEPIGTKVEIYIPYKFKGDND